MSKTDPFDKLDVSFPGRILQQYELIMLRRNVPVYTERGAEQYVVHLDEHDVLIYMGTSPTTPLRGQSPLLLYNFTMYSSRHNALVYIPYTRALLTDMTSSSILNTVFQAVASW